MVCNRCKKECLESELNNGYCNECKDNKQEDTKLPMRWLKFWLYVRFPLGIIISFRNLSMYQDIPYSTNKIVALCIDIITLAFIIITYLNFTERKKIGYKLLKVWLYVGEWLLLCFTNTLQVTLTSSNSIDYLNFVITYVIVLFIWGIIWVLPNSIYFKKRKHYFNIDTKINNIDKTSQNTMINKEDKKQETEVKKEEQTQPQEKLKQYKNIIIALTVSLIILVVGIIILACYTFNLKQTSEEEALANKTKINILNSDLNWEKQQYEYYRNKYYDIKDKSEFMDNHIVIIAENTYIYHKYDCQYLDTSRFLAFNIENAIGRGYVACKHCIK